MFVYKRHKKYYVYFAKNKRISLDTILKQFSESENHISWQRLKEVIIPYLENNQYHKSTIYLYAKVINDLRNIIKTNPLNLTPIDFERYKQSRLEVIKPVSLNIELNKIQSMYNILFKLNIIQKPIKIIKVFEHKKPPIAIENFEMELIIENAKPVIKEYIIFDLNTGLRLSELINLKVDNVKSDYIEIKNKLNFKVKCDKSRIVPLNDKAKSVIHTVISSDIKADYLSKSFKKIVRKLNLNEQYNFHTIRKTFATNCANNGMIIFELSQILGHSDIKTTQIYYHVKLDNAKAVINTI